MAKDRTVGDAVRKHAEADTFSTYRSLQFLGLEDLKLNTQLAIGSINGAANLYSVALEIIRKQAMELEGLREIRKPKPSFDKLPVGAIFQTRDGRASEGFTWVGLVKVSDTECSRLVVSPIKMRAIAGPLPSLATYQSECPVGTIITDDMRIDSSQFEAPTVTYHQRRKRR